MDARTKWLVLGGGVLAAFGWWLTSTGSGSDFAGNLFGSDLDADLEARLLADARIPDSVRQWVPQAISAADGYSPRELDRETWVRLILAVIEQESAGNPNAIGDAGKSYGLMQIHTGFHPEFAALPASLRLDPQTNINNGASILTEGIDYWMSSFPDDRLLGLRAGVAEYNAGRGGVRKAVTQGLDVDSYTYLKRYSASVLRRFMSAGGLTAGV